MVTAEEIPDHFRTSTSGRCSTGDTLQDATTGQMVRSGLDPHRAPVEVGDTAAGNLISTGSPGGAGYCAQHPQVFLRDRSTVTVGIDGIGSLTTHCRILD